MNWKIEGKYKLTAETVQSTSLAFQTVNYIHGGNGLPLGMLGVGNGITDNVLQEYLEDSAGLFVDETGDTLDTTTTSQPTDCRLGDTLDIITQDLPVPLGASLAQTFASFSSASHVESCYVEMLVVTA